MTVDPEQAHVKTPLVTSELLGKAKVPDLPFETPEGKSYVIDTDCFGKKRNLSNPSAGPFEKPGVGRVTLKIWPR
jgi:alpha-N-arabinofuranosidase